MFNKQLSLAAVAAVLSFVSESEQANVFDQIIHKSHQMADDLVEDLKKVDWDKVSESVDNGIDQAGEKIKSFSDEYVNIDQLKEVIYQTSDEFTDGDSLLKKILQQIADFSMLEYIQDYDQQTQYIQDATNFVNALAENDSQDLKCNMRTGLDPTSVFMFLPELSGTLSPSSPTASWEGVCFKSIEGELVWDEDNLEQTEIHLTLKDAKSAFCNEYLMMGNTGVQEIQSYFLHGKKKITMKYPSDNARLDTAYNGFTMYTFCEKPKYVFASILKTLTAFVGGLTTHPKIPVVGSHVPEYMEKANIEWMSSFGYDMVKRETTKVEIDESLIHSGDFLAVTRLDGLDPLIMYGTGTHAGHSVMAMWFPDGELYAVESQDSWYWPYKNIQKNKFKDWLKYAEDASYHVTHLPLSDEAQATWDHEKALEFFNKTEGLPYGYHNFVFGWVDTPTSNLPPLMPSNFLPIAFSLVEKIKPDFIDLAFNQGMNKRLETEGLNLEAIAAEAAKRNMSIQDVWAMPEHDGWIYTGEEPRDGESYVCSAFVAAIYKAAGLFGDDVDEINATEMVPKDVYTINFFKDSWDRPQQCVDADPDIPWCQLLGNYRQTFPGYNTISEYKHMSEHCQSIAPDFYRPDGC